MNEVKAVLRSIHFKWISDPENGPMEIEFRDANSGAYWSNCVPKGVRIDDPLIKALRETATECMTTWLQNHPEEKLLNIRDLKTSTEKLRKALRDYAAHKLRCTYSNTRLCNCGFSEVLRL
jgi:hypothetical protein